MKTICVVTTTRADYGLLYSPIKEILKLETVQVKIVVTGTHLSQKHGYTVDVIRQDGFQIDSEIDIGIQGDRPKDILKIMSNTLLKFSDYFEQSRPDIVLLLGDRFEVFSIAQAAFIHNIAIAHIHGGEVTEGALDDAFRHSITKMAKIHFVANDIYRKRVIQLGEDPQKIVVSGAPGLDNIKNLKLLSRSELEGSLGVKFKAKNILCTFHPVTSNESISTKETTSLFAAISELDIDTNVFITMPNADSYSSIVESEVHRLRKLNSDRIFIFTSLGQLRYLSLMKEVDLVLGNSSSGIIEAPFLKKAVVNVGIRQQGRVTSGHVIQASGDKQSISKAIALAFSNSFQAKLQNIESNYGKGDAGEKIASALSIFIDDGIPKKFYDLA